MIKIKIISVGKTKESWLEEAISEYVKRLQGVLSFEFIWVKNDEQLIVAASKEPIIVCLDPAGSSKSSEEFALYFKDKVVQAGSRLAFVIGGAEGLPKEIKSRGDLLSLSKLTFTHQLTRLVLVEQIYRATEIIKGTQYHK